MIREALWLLTAIVVILALVGTAWLLATLFLQVLLEVLPPAVRWALTAPAVPWIP